MNTAGFRWTRNENGGTESIFGTNANGIAALNGLGRKQLNGKIDHNFNARNKLGVSYTYERSAGNANYETLPGGFRGSVFRHPQTLALNLTSTLSSTLVNEVRVGMRRIGGNSFNGFSNPETSKAAQAFYPNYNGYPVYLGLGGGTVNFQSNGPLGSGTTAQYNDTTALSTYGDSLSWTRGKHGFKAGGELRFGHSLGYDAGISLTAHSSRDWRRYLIRARFRRARLLPVPTCRDSPVTPGPEITRECGICSVSLRDRFPASRSSTTCRIADEADLI